MLKKGFTLIELLITITIIGILSAIVAVNFIGQQAKARDAQRKSDLDQYRIALENYAGANNGSYPSGGSGTRMDNICTASLSGYTSACPEDPKGSPTSWYAYASNGSQYIIYVAGNGLEVVTGTAWVVCSNGQSGKVPITTTWSSTGGCPSNITQ